MRAYPASGSAFAESGRKTWVVMYRHGGRLRRLTLGTYPALSLSTARESAKNALADSAGGRDPAAEKRAERKADSFGELAERYIERYAKRRKRSWKEDRRALDRDLLPRFRNRKAADIKRREIIDALEAIRARGAPILANRTLEIVRRIFNWGIKQDYVAVNPAAGIERPSEEKQRDRVLRDDELRALWKALDQEPLRVAARFKLQLLTAQRSGEVRNMRWADVDTPSGWWTIPAQFSKDRRAHRVPLTPQAIDMIEGIEHEDSQEWVFPSPTTEGPIRSNAKHLARIRERCDVDFVPHDLRRTAASRLTGDLTISRLTVAKILNHVESGVTAVYDRHSYDREKREALEAWARRLAGIVRGKRASWNVVELSPARK